jgi:hypothetical protein
MSTETSPLHKFVHKRFREIFGDPDNALGRDDHWALKPSPYQASINVLVNGTSEAPAVWVFDPHVPNDGVLRKLIKSESEIEELVKHIQKRIEQAAAKGDGSQDGSK